MTMPAPAQGHPQHARPPGGLHYGWIIVGILVVVQVIGSAISQSAGVMVAALLIPGLTVLVLWWAHDVWTFYLFGSLFGIGFGGEMSAYLVVNRQYFGTGPTSTLYGWEMMGAMLGHAVATALAGLVLARTGSFPLVLALSMAFSLGGVLVILHLESSARVLIPHWEVSLPPEAHALPTDAVPLTRCPETRGPERTPVVEP
jgi:MFS family permease